MKNYFANTLRLIKFSLKKDWVNIVVWTFILVMLVMSTAAAYKNLYSSQEDMLAMSVFFDNPAMIAMMGPLFGKETITTASLFSASILVFLAITIGIMNIFLVIRNTRADEERGRIELIRSLPVGRMSNLSATLITAFLVNLLIAIFSGIALGAVQLNGGSFGGAILFGFALGVIGLFFSGLTAVFCQILQSSRSVLGLSLGALILLYLLRAMGDVENEAISMLSPLGVILRVKCFVDNNWYPIFVVLGIYVAILVLAFYLNSIRDLDQGLIRQRNGKKEASSVLRYPEGLALRLLKNGIIAWTVGIFVIAISYGSILGDLEAFIEGSGFIKELLVPPEGHTQTEMFITIIVSMLAIAAAVPTAGAVLKLANEEKQHRLDNIFSKAVSRHRILTGYLIIGFVESVVMMFMALIGMWLAAVSVMETPISFSAIFNSFMVYLPAIWVVLGLATLLVGVMPNKASLIVNSFIGFSFVIIYLGTLMDLPKVFQYFSSFGYIPKLPMESVSFLTLSLLTLVAAGLTALGYYFYRQRDLL